MKMIERLPKHNRGYTMPNDKKSYILGKMSINGVSRINVLASWVI